MANQRILSVFERVTADGYFAASDGSLNFADPDPEVERAGAAGIPLTDTLLLGRRTYEMFASFWPHALAQPDTPDPHGGPPSAEQRAFAVALNAMTKIVFSTTLKEAGWNNSRIARKFEPKAIAELKAQPGKGIIVLGSGSIVSQLTEHGLVDEYQLVVTPIFLGSGRPLLTNVAKAKPLSLIESKAYRSGNVMLRYAPAR